MDMDTISAKMDNGTRMVVLTEASLNAAIEELEDERDRARALAAKLEEVVAMRTLVLETICLSHGAGHSIEAHVHWARAQLSEIP